MLADLDNRLKYRQLSAKGVRVFGKFRLTGASIAWAMFGLGATLAWLFRNGILDSYDQEFAIHPNFDTGKPNGWTDAPHSYWLPSVVDFVWVMSFFLLCDLSPAVRTFFQLSEYHYHAFCSARSLTDACLSIGSEAWSVLGRNAFSLYLLHGVVFWSAGSAVVSHQARISTPPILTFPCSPTDATPTRRRCSILGHSADQLDRQSDPAFRGLRDVHTHI